MPVDQVGVGEPRAKPAHEAPVARVLEVLTAASPDLELELGVAEQLPALRRGLADQKARGDAVIAKRPHQPDGAELSAARLQLRDHTCDQHRR